MPSEIWRCAVMGSPRKGVKAEATDMQKFNLSARICFAVEVAPGRTPTQDQ
jgi:hypothetical protein